MLLWLMNLGFAGGGMVVHPSPWRPLWRVRRR